MYLLFDIGATHMRLAISRSGRKLDKIVIANTPGKYKDGLSLFESLAEGLLNGKKPKLAVGGVASPLDHKTGKLLNFIQSDWSGKRLLKNLKNILGTKVILENDAALAALGEAKYGSGKKKKIVAYLTISTGIGGARVVNGKIDNNTFGYEPRLQILKNHPIKNFGSLSSGTAIKAIYHKPGEELKDKKAWKEIELWLTMGLNNVVVLWSPDIVVLGGPVALNKNISLPRIQKSLNKNLKIIKKKPKIVRASLKQKSGLMGALTLIPK